MINSRWSPRIPPSLLKGRWGLKTAGPVVALAIALTLASCSGPPQEAPIATQSPAAASAETVVVDELSQAEQNEGVKVEIPGPVQVAYRKITLKPGAGTGRHCHDGQLIAAVGQGVFSHYAPTYPGGVRTYEAGDSIVEGAGYVHEGKNEGTTNVVLWVTYLIPKGKPLAQTDLKNCEQ